MAEKNFKIEKVEKLPDAEAQIIGEITLDFLNTCRKDALKHLNSHLDLPGFRKGNIPEDILIKTVGEMHVLEETAEVALAKEYGNIITESELKPITRPEIKITKMAPGIPLAFQINLALEPEFELPNYKKIAEEVKPASTREGEPTRGGEEDKPASAEGSGEAREKRRLQILENIVKETKIEFPKRFIDAEVTHMLHHFKHDVEKAGIKWEEYLEKAKKTEEEVRKSFAEQIVNRAKAEFIIGKIAEKENLKTYGEVFAFLEKVN